LVIEQLTGDAGSVYDQPRKRSDRIKYCTNNMFRRTLWVQQSTI